MVGLFNKKIKRRKFRYYPRHIKDEKQSSLSTFGTSYKAKKADADMELDSLSSGKSFKFKRNLKIEKEKEFLRRMRINLILMVALAALIYGIYWVVTHQEFFLTYSNKWGT